MNLEQAPTVVLDAPVAPEAPAASEVMLTTEQIVTQLKGNIDRLFDASAAVPGLPKRVGSLTTSRSRTDAKGADGSLYTICKQVTSDSTRNQSDSVIYEISPLNSFEHKDDLNFDMVPGKQATSIVYGIANNVVLTRHGLDTESRLHREDSEFTEPQDVARLLAKMQGITAIKEV